jgi:hypothetical protein
MEGTKKILILHVVLVTLVAKKSCQKFFDAILDLSCPNRWIFVLYHFVSLVLTTKGRLGKPH